MKEKEQESILAPPKLKAGWILVLTIFIIGMLFGYLYYATNVSKPNAMRQNYDYCVKACNIIFERPLRYCQTECEKLIRSIG